MYKSSRIQDALILITISAMTLAAFYVSYSFKLSSPVITIVWILWLVTGLGLAYFTATGQKVFDFGKQAKSELHKVVWPSRKETLQTTAIVVIMVTLAGFILWMADSGLMWIIGKLTHLG